MIIKCEYCGITINPTANTHICQNVPRPAIDMGEEGGHVRLGTKPTDEIYDRYNACNGSCKDGSSISTYPIHNFFVSNTVCKQCGHINGYHLENCVNDTKTLTLLGE